jgi:ABC-type nickel/cobalt efflux system permease component RcnA
MKTIKILVGIVFAIAAVNVLITMANKEQGTGLAGAMSGFLILAGVSVWLLYSGIKSKTKTKKKDH